MNTWKEALKHIDVNGCTSNSHTQPTFGKIEYTVPRTKAVYVSFGDMRVIWRNKYNKKQ